jgi:uncharacterized membrane protein
MEKTYLPVAFIAGCLLEGLWTHGIAGGILSAVYGIIFLAIVLPILFALFMFAMWLDSVHTRYLNGEAKAPRWLEVILDKLHRV